MMLLAFSIFDNKTQAFMRPFFCLTPGEAVRTFSDSVNAADSPFFRHPEDYSLFQIGLYDDASGMLTGDNHLPLGVASNFKIGDSNAT